MRKVVVEFVLIVVTTLSAVGLSGAREIRCGNSVFVVQSGQRSGQSGTGNNYKCCGSSIYDKRNATCCGGETVIPLDDPLDRGCCSQTIYNKTSQICCTGRFLHAADSRTSCCGKLSYDTRRYLCENGKLVGYHEDTCATGRTVIVHLFDWKWTDIAEECERYLGPAGFCGVQVSPPNEHVEIDDPPRPWYERYQPISYKLTSRSGNESEFREMVRRCNAVDVRIFVDAVINHMCGHGIGAGNGSAGTPFDSVNFQFPGVPFGPTDFNCCRPKCHKCRTESCNIDNFGDANQVRNCRLLGLLDLDLGKTYVRQKVADFMNVLIDLGVAGFRIDAAKHMWPGDFESILGRLNSLATPHGFSPGTRPFIFMEVIDQGGEPIQGSEYLHLGRVTEFKFSRDIGRVFRRHFHLSSFRSFPQGWGFVPSHQALIFVDNHDNQRGHGGGGSAILTFYDQKLYTLATTFTLAHSYGFTRIMSSHRWEGGPSTNDWIGPPHEADYSIKTVEMHENGSCKGDWVCEHRWHAIRSMVKFRNVVNLHPVTNWWDNGFHQVAFSRGDQGFVAINNEPHHPLRRSIQTGMPPGNYCDVISGEKTENNCTGSVIVVGADGRAEVEIPAALEVPAVAIHTESKLRYENEEERGEAEVGGGGGVGREEVGGEIGVVTEEVTGQGVIEGTEVGGIEVGGVIGEEVTEGGGGRGGGVTGGGGRGGGGVTGGEVTGGGVTEGGEGVTLEPRTTDAGSESSGYNRTVILARFVSAIGQHVFIRGGISHERRLGCSSDANLSRCAIPIRYRDVATGDHHRAYRSWRTGDSRLDWYGQETNQGLFDGQPAQGTPTYWTTNNRSHSEAYSDLNRYGDHYWMVDVDMDCDATEHGWFELKLFVLGSSGWESDISQQLVCVGSAGGSRPYASKNHLARCGFINVFVFGDGGCVINRF